LHEGEKNTTYEPVYFDFWPKTTLTLIRIQKLGFNTAGRSASIVQPLLAPPHYWFCLPGRRMHGSFSGKPQAQAAAQLAIGLEWSSIGMGYTTLCCSVRASLML
jgi:hypothetical protein